MKTYKKYENRKYYDSDKAGYVNAQEILTSYLSGGAKVVEHATGNDITAQTISRALAESFDPERLIKLLAPLKRLEQEQASTQVSQAE